MERYGKDIVSENEVKKSDQKIFEQCKYCPQQEDCQNNDKGKFICYCIIPRYETYSLLKNLSSNAFKLYIFFNLDNKNAHIEWFHNNRVTMSHEFITYCTNLNLDELLSSIEELVDEKLIIETPIVLTDIDDITRRCFSYYLNWETHIDRKAR